MADALSDKGGMGRGGLDRYLGPQAVEASQLPPSVANGAAAPDPERKIDCAGSDANEAVCEIAKAEEQERGEDSAT